MPTLIWHVFGPHMLSCILCLLRHLVGFFIEGRDTFFILALMKWIFSTQVDILFLSSPGMVGVWFYVSAYIAGVYVDIHIVSALAWEQFNQHMLRLISCPLRQERVWSTHVEIHFVSSLAFDGNCSSHVDMLFVFTQAYEGIGQHMLIFLFCSGWQRMVWRSHVELHLVY